MRDSGLGVQGREHPRDEHPIGHSPKSRTNSSQSSNGSNRSAPVVSYAGYVQRVGRVLGCIGEGGVVGWGAFMARVEGAP